MTNWPVQRDPFRKRDDMTDEESGQSGDESVAVAIELDTSSSSEND
jgi:hypothetical protein